MLYKDCLTGVKVKNYFIIDLAHSDCNNSEMARRCYSSQAAYTAGTKSIIYLSPSYFEPSPGRLKPHRARSTPAERSGSQRGAPKLRTGGVAPVGSGGLTAAQVSRPGQLLLRFAPSAAGHGAVQIMTDAESTPNDETNENQDQTNHVIFVDGAGNDDRQTYDEDVVEAVNIIEEAGYDEDPEKYILEALKGQRGDVDEQFDPKEEAGPNEVDLTEQHRTHFQVTTRGEVFI